MSWNPAPGSFGFGDPLLLLLLALGVEAYVGERTLFARRVIHPHALVSRVTGALQRRLDRPERGEDALRQRGYVLAATIVLGAALVGATIALITRFYPFAWVLEVWVLTFMIAQRGTWRRTAAVNLALLDGSVEGAREALRILTQGRIPAERLEAFGAPGICGAAIPAIADRFVERLVAPVFWFVLLGLPGLFAQQAVSVAASRLGGGHPPSACGPIARPLVALDGILAFLPDRLAGLLLAAGARFLPGGRPGAALERLSGSRNWPRAALVGALGLATNDPASVAAPGLKLVADALRVFVAACALNAALVALVLLLRLVW